MERKSFLYSMPFLFPIASSSWPPRNQLAEEKVEGRRETLLRDSFLSIEPLSQEGINQGPAFFISVQNQIPDFDPAMCAFEMAIYTVSSNTANTP